MNRLEYLTRLCRLLEDGGLAEDEINDAVRLGISNGSRR